MLPGVLTGLEYPLPFFFHSGDLDATPLQRLFLFPSILLSLLPGSCFLGYLPNKPLVSKGLVSGSTFRRNLTKTSGYSQSSVNIEIIKNYDRSHVGENDRESGPKLRNEGV